MQRALELADRAVGRTSPNPAVGAVVVANGRIVGEGLTQPPGQAHAEVVAIAAAGERARGAELFVTLEPCCHFGRTPPCTNAVIDAGISVVHVAALDPNPLVNGKSVAVLRQANLTVDVGSHYPEAAKLNAPFFHFIRTRRPFVTVKWAMTLDGKIAARSGDSRWITSDQARASVHRERDTSDAIVVGIGTALADNPALTVRLEAGDDTRAPRRNGPWRVVVDSQARLPLASKLVRENPDRRALVVASTRAEAERVDRLRENGVDVALVPPDAAGRVDLRGALDELARRGATRILVEGGSELIGALFDSRLVDRVLAFVAPKIVGGRDAPTPAGARGVDRMADALSLDDCEFRQIGPDLLVEGRLTWPE